MLSLDNQCAIRSAWSFNSYWPYDWDEACLVQPEDLYGTAQLVTDAESDVRDIAVGDGMEMGSWMLLPLQWEEVHLDGTQIMDLVLIPEFNLDLEHTIILMM